MAEKTPEGKLLDLIKKAQGKLKLRKELKVFTKVNIILICVIIVILVIVLVDVFTSNHKVPELSIEVPQQEIEAIAVKTELDEDVEIVLEERDVSVPKKEIAKDLNLLGIITGATDQAIIENSQTSKTFFLYKGDRFLGFTVYDIKESKVILDYKGEKVELKI